MTTSLDFDVYDECLITGILPHRTIYYRLAAYNVTGDKVVGARFSAQLSNNAPTVPEGMAPEGFTSGNTRLSWNPTDDVDNDGLTYHVYMKKASESDFTLLGSTTGISYPPGEY